MAILPSNSAQIVGGIVPNVYIKRIILDNRHAGNTPYRGNDPHIDIPQWSPPMNVNGTVNNPPAWAESNKGLLETPRKIKPSSWIKAQAHQAYLANSPLFIKVDFAIKEEVDKKSQSSLINNSEVKKFLKIAVVVSFSEQYSNSIISGERTSILPANTDEEKYVLHETTGLTGEDKGASMRMDTTFAGNSKIYNINFSKNFSIDNNTPQHVTVFAQAMIDKHAVEEIYSVSLSNSSFLTRFDGKPTSEPVIDKGNMVEKSHYYQDNNEEVWVGEVDAVLPVGQTKINVVKKGTNEVLHEVSTNNTIIQDYRMKKKFDNMLIDFSEPEKLFTQNYKQLTKNEFSNNKTREKMNFFSNLFSSKNLSNNVKVAFAVNLKNLYIHDSKYGSAWNNINTEDKLKIFAQDTFHKIVLCRRRLKKPSLANSPSKIFDESEPVEIIAEGTFNGNFALSYGKQHGRFGRIGINSPLEEDIFKNLRNPDDETNLWVWFAGIDNSIDDHDRGYYQYGVRYIFEDKLENLLTKKKRILANDLSNLKRFHKASMQPSFYDNITDSFTEKYKNGELENYKQIVLPALVNFIDTHQAFAGGDYEEKEKMAMMLQVISSPLTGSPDGLTYVVNMIENFLSLVERLVDNQSISNTNSDKSNTYSPASSISTRKNLTEETYWFKDIVDCSAKENMGYEFLRTLSSKGDISVYNEIAGLPLVKYGDFETRVSVEAKKYFNKGVKSNFIVNKDKNFSGELVETSTSAFTYLAPSMVKAGDLGIFSNGTVLGTKKISKIDYNKLNLVLLKIYKSRLDSLDTSSMVDVNTESKLTYQQKQKKYQLNEILKLKGATTSNPLEPGVKIQKNYNVIDDYLSFDAENNQQLTVETSSEYNERDITNPPMLNEINYNDSLLFLADVRKEDKNSHFHNFLEKLYSEDISIENLSQSGLPNHYKYLIKLHNPNDSPLVDTAGDNKPSIKNIVNLPFNTIKQSTSGKPAFGYKEGFLFLDSMDKKFGLWMNFFNLMEVKYFDGFLEGKNQPVFRRLTAAKFKQFKDNKNVILCKLVRYNNPAFGIENDSLLNLQTLDQYFLLGTDEFLSKITGNIDFDSLKETSATYLKLQNQLNTMSNVPNEYMNTAPSTKTLTKSQKNVSPGVSPGGSLGAAMGGMSPGGGGTSGY